MADEWTKKKFEKYIGKQVTINLTNQKSVFGRMTVANIDSVELQDKNKQGFKIPFERISSISSKDRINWS